MKINGTRQVYVYFLIISLICMMSLPCVDAAFFYKSYVIRYDRGWNILCDPYVVKKDDWVFKLFRQKGEISNKDFPEFLRIFKRLNPHINDIDRIRPGQNILIPLKKVDQDDLYEPSSGVVTIPYLTDAALPDNIAENSTDYLVKKGDCVSILLSERYGKYGTQSYLEGEQLFREMNPQIENLNLIYAGQTIRLPDPKYKSQLQGKPQPQPQHQRPIDSEIIQKNPEKNRLESSVAFNEEISLPSGVENQQVTSDSPLSKVATVLDAQLYNKGNYYIPMSGQKDYKIDLSQTPFIKLEDGKRLFFTTGDKDKSSDIRMLKSFWKDVLIVNVDPNDPVEKVFNSVIGNLSDNVVKHRLSFSDNGVDVDVRGRWIIEKPRKKGEAIRHLCITIIDDFKERTPLSIVRYLDQNNIIIKEILIGKHIKEPKSNISRFNIKNKNAYNIDASNHETFVKNFLTAMGYQYFPNKNISFQYAGIPINADSNLAAKGNDNFYIDFGNFYGDALQSIEESGYSIIQIKDNDNLENIIEKLLGAMKATFIKHPKFLAAKRPADYNTQLTIPGFLVNNEDGHRVLLTTVSLHLQVIHFLKDNDISIFRMNLKDRINE
jgi:hypothetical protein